MLLTGCNAVGTLEKTGCKLLPAGNTKDHCWQDAAVRLSMPSVCYFIKGYKFDVVDNSPPMTKCFLRIAEKEKDATICNHIVEGHPNGYTKDDCYLATAIAAKNTGFCDLIQNNESRMGVVNSRESCYLSVGQRPTYCADSKEPAKCLSAIAIDMIDVSICEDASEKKDESLCLMNAIEGIQKKIMGTDNLDWNAEQCKKFNDPNLKYSCSLLAVAAFQKDAACNNILETQYNELCKLFIQFHKELPSKYTDTEKQKAITECGKFTILEFKGICMLAFGHELELTAGNEGPGSDRNEMYIDAIEFYFNGCKLVGAFEKDTPAEAAFVCMLLPGNILEPSFCANYKENDVKDFCYVLAAMQTGDCSNVKDSDAKTECKDIILPYYQAQERVCGKLRTDAEKHSECQKEYTTGYFMERLGVRMTETMKNFMKGK
jgi:hypothetical protein